MNSKVNGRCESACCASIRSSQAGFSLIELMVASTIGLLIMAAVLTLFLNVSRTNDEMAKTNVLIENGRFAIQLLQNDIVHAGFWDVYIPDFDDLTLLPKTATSAGVAPVTTPNAIPDPCLAYSLWPGTGTPLPNSDKNLLGIAVQVHDSVPAGCTSLITHRKADTDILVVRHAETCVAGAAGCESTASDERLYFQASRCSTDTTKYVLTTTGTELTLRKRNCSISPTSADLAPKRRYISNIYYVRDYSTTMGDGIPTLVRSEFDLESDAVKAKAAVPLIEGIEGFRVELGVDRISDAGIDIIDASSDNDHYRKAVDWADADNLTSPKNRGDGVPDEFVHCESDPDSESYCSVDRLVSVVAVKLHLLARSLTSTAGYVDGKTYKLGDQTITPTANDGFKRHVFSTVVRLNNISGRRETP